MIKLLPFVIMKKLLNKHFFTLLVLMAAGTFLTANLFAQTKYEAESATLAGVTSATAHTGYSGSGYVDGFDNTADRVTFNVNVATAGSYPLVIRYSAPSGE